MTMINYLKNVHKRAFRTESSSSFATTIVVQGRRVTVVVDGRTVVVDTVSFLRRIS